MTDKAILSIDWGKRFFGVAVAKNCLAVRPLGTWERHQRWHVDASRFQMLIQSLGVFKVVVGWPLGHETPNPGPLGFSPSAKEPFLNNERCKTVWNFCELLEKHLQTKGHNLPIVFWDESLSSWESEQRLSRSRSTCDSDWWQLFCRHRLHKNKVFCPRQKTMIDQSCKAENRYDHWAAAVFLEDFLAAQGKKAFV